MRKMSPEEIEKHERNPNILLTIDGEKFRCRCGCNVFHHINNDKDMYSCNACKTNYESVEA